MFDIEEINKLGCWEWHLLSFDGHRLCLAGGTDLTYYHVAEVWFSGVTYLCCPTRLLHATFRYATDTESRAAGRIVDLTESNIVVAVNAETTARLEAMAFFIVADKIELVAGTVYYYERADLKPGERIAPWVHSKKK